MVVMMLTMMGVSRRGRTESEDIICSSAWEKLAIMSYIIVPYVIFIRRIT